MIITIDGPTASGKSTIGRLIAQKLHYYYLYSGLLYRALAYLLMQQYGYARDHLMHPTLSHVYNILELNHMRYHFDPKTGEHIYFKGNDITSFLKVNDVDQAASIISTHKKVREVINKIQKDIASHADNIIIDGRDAGTVVFPHANLKFYLTAVLSERARRWQLAQQEKGKDVSFEDALQSLKERDLRDKCRIHDPLTIAHNAIIIDTTQLTIDAVVAMIIKYIN